MLTQALPATATDYARTQRLEQQAAIAAVGRQWRRMGSDFDGSWNRIAPTITAIVATAQQRIATNADAFIPAILEETGQAAAIPAAAPTNLEQFVGVTGAGIAVADSLAAAPIRAKQATQAVILADAAAQVTTMLPGKTTAQALTDAGKWLSFAVGTILSDTHRAVGMTGMYTRDVSGFVRMLNPPSCSRCVILAGRWYRKNAGFPRHPGCDCAAIPASESIAGDILVDPQAYYDSLDQAGRIKLAGSQANARAIEDGADLTQVVNAYRRTAGMQFAQVSPIKSKFGNKYTTEGATRRAVATQQQVALRRNGKVQPRLMPESIYRTSESREDALRRLRLYGWIRDDEAAAQGRTIFADQRRISRAERARQRRADQRLTRSRADAAPPTGYAGGNGVPPGRGAPRSSDPGDMARSRAYWKARQDLVAMDFADELLDPQEIVFAERFTALGHRATWIAKDQLRRSTNDFVWHDQGGIEVEVKATTARYQSIHSRILTASSRAWRRHEVVKENFIIDLGSQALTEELRDQLAGYNEGRQKYRLRRLWVLDRAGLTEIALRT